MILTLSAASAFSAPLRETCNVFVSRRGAEFCRGRSEKGFSSGRKSISEATQALCFMAGANSIFTGDKLLTAANAGDDKDAAMLAKLRLVPMEAEEPLRACKALEAAE
jgi:Biotin and Thiamin Synthesis associated domain